VGSAAIVGIGCRVKLLTEANDGIQAQRVKRVGHFNDVPPDLDGFPSASVDRAIPAYTSGTLASPYTDTDPYTLHNSPRHLSRLCNRLNLRRNPPNLVGSLW